jgi:uncharacterized protein (DUF697 family)
MFIMAATIVGLSSVTFGGSAETVAVFTSFSQTSDSDKTIVVDEDGDHVAVAYHGKKSVASMSGFLKAATPIIGASITLANATASLGGVTGTFFVDSVAVSRAPNDFQQVTIGASNHNF